MPDEIAVGIQVRSLPPPRCQVPTRRCIRIPARLGEGVAVTNEFQTGPELGSVIHAP